MPKPIIAIVGRPNVGKSSLFNRLVGRRVAVVDETPGVTRDRLAADVSILGRKCILIDTGGFEVALKDDPIGGKVIEQVEYAIEQANVIVFLVDAIEGPTATDHEIAQRLRKQAKPIVFAANKVDAGGADLTQFYELRLGEPIGISAIHGKNINALCEAILSHLPPPDDEDEDGERVRIAIVGRPNVGKSALLNSILGEERAIVSPIPGTTRDAIDTPFEWRGRKLLLIDTAGLRRKARIKRRLEYYCVVRALSAIDRGDVALLVIDALEGATHQDARIAGYAHEGGKPVVIVINKWDLILERVGADELESKEARRQEKLLRQDYERLIRQQLKFVDYAPIEFTSAVKGEGIDGVLEKALYCYEQTLSRVTTGALNRAMQEFLAAHPPPMIKGRRLKVYYATQPEVKPPTFVLFVNDPELMHFSYMRYLENRLRERFSLDATPIRILLRPSHERKRNIA
ncbi:MAG: ribosome biogenesis GTPase Der [Armatimonadota bacterium]|nr:ribosome biogenesis GTPase Der [Armatimonadota bacterium]MCX7777671.1 ribosome biogenesis GTPase Der [Armatimonadota bacterium]MDW8025430.1 ribosome biogenesis GTPase Der [Armatimonadota bacterium]